MRRLVGMVAILLLAGCQQPNVIPADSTDELRDAQARIEQLEKENTDLKAQKPTAKKSGEMTTAQSNNDRADAYGGDSGDESAAKTNLCWQDYCPCDETVTSLDRTICRNARAGVEMSDDQWAIGAQARDAKREGDRLSREADDILSDMRANR